MEITIELVDDDAFDSAYGGGRCTGFLDRELTKILIKMKPSEMNPATFCPEMGEAVSRVIQAEFGDSFAEAHNLAQAMMEDAMAVLHRDGGVGGVTKHIYTESSEVECRRAVLFVDDVIYWAEAARDRSLISVDARHLRPLPTLWLAIQIAERRVVGYRSLKSLLREFDAGFGFSSYHLPVEPVELTAAYLLTLHASFGSKIPVDGATKPGRIIRLRHAVEMIQKQTNADKP